MSARSLELLLKRINKRLSTDIRDTKLQKGGVTHSFRVNTGLLTSHFKDKSVYNLDSSTATLAANSVVNSLNAKFPKGRLIKGGYTYYTASSYGVVDAWKRTLAKDPAFVNLLGDGSEEFSKAFHIGHGSDKTLAAVEYRTLLAYKEWQKFAKRYKIAENALDLTFLESAAGKKLEGKVDLDSISIKAQSSTIFTSAGNIKKAFVLYVELQPASENVGSRSAEERRGNAAFKIAIENAILNLVERQDWSESKASPSVIKYIDTAIDKALQGKSVIGKASVSKASVSNGKKKKKKKTRKLVVPTLASIKSKQIVALNAAKRISTVQRLQDPRGRFTSLVNVTSMINALLQGQLKGNMKAPALVYRSGRLASSVKVTQMNFTREGQVTAFYEYMKRPYQTFERGHKQGNEFRDPRRLIDKSIREIAEMYIHSKFDLRTRRM